MAIYLPEGVAEANCGITSVHYVHLSLNVGTADDTLTLSYHGPRHILLSNSRKQRAIDMKYSGKSGLI